MFKALNNITSKVQIVEDSVTNMELTINKQAYHLIDQEARGMGNNLVFWGISGNETRDCKRLMYNFLNIDSNSFCIKKAHLIGSLNRNRQYEKRPIVILFRNYTDTENILRQHYKLKGTRFGVYSTISKRAETRKL